MTAKERYKTFCDQHQQIPLFMQYWWMEAVCRGKEWDVLLSCDANGDIVAAMPYLWGKRWGLKFVLHPQLTQYSGIWIKELPLASELERLSFEQRVYSDLINQLELLQVAFFKQNFSPAFKNWLPFYWRSFQQTTRYTYRLENIGNPEALFDHFSRAKKKQIRKAEKSLEIRFDMQPATFYEMQCCQLKHNGKSNVLSKELVVNLIQTACARNQGVIISAVDKEGVAHAALFIAYDAASAYNLISAIHPQHRASGGSTLVVWEAIRHLSDKTEAFDFEGSMIEGVEHSFRQFGATQTPYFQIRKFNYKWLQVAFDLWYR